MRLMRDKGSLKHVIANDGIGERTLLSITIFPAEDKNLLDHPLAFCLIRSTIEVKRSFFFLPKCSAFPYRLRIVFSVE
ncbi:unnamed protein product, partial [Brassica oleracea]